jgi:hypothetical protein
LAHNTYKRDVEQTEPKEEELNKSIPYCSKIMLNIPYLEKISISLAFSAVILLLLPTISQLLLFNVIPAQAQTHLSFRTTEPASGSDADCMAADATLTFDAQGTPSSSNPQHLDITSGTFKVTARDDEQKSYSGNLASGSFTSNSGGGVENFALGGTIDNASNTTNCSIEGATFSIGAPCSTSNDGASNPVTISTHYVAQVPVFNNFNGVVECSPQGGGGGGGDTTTQSPSTSSSMAGSSQDTDGDGDGDSDDDDDGLSDAGDNCPNNPYLRCYTEGTTTVVVHSNR